MHKFFTDKENFYDNKAKILGDDVKHLYRVLRLNEGDTIVLNTMLNNNMLTEIN